MLLCLIYFNETFFYSGATEESLIQCEEYPHIYTIVPPIVVSR